MSILWDEKELQDKDANEMIQEITELYSEYKKEIAVSASGSMFMGIATDKDQELFKKLLALPSEVRDKVLTYIVSITNDKPENPKSNLKELLLSSPHKDVAIQIERSTGPSRDILL